jgi:Tfp pilus assembly protein PilF
MAHLIKTHERILICLCVIVITLTVYWPVKNHEFIHLDDPLYVTENVHVQGGLTREGVIWALTTDHASNWHPLTWLSLMGDYEVYRLNPAGYHWTNLLFHIANTVLLFLVLHRMTGAMWRSGMVAVLFALHPLHVESVAWVSERKGVLSTLFWMLTMYAYVVYVERPAVKRYVLVVVAFALGLMAKPMLVTLPFVLLLLDYWPLGRLRTGFCIKVNGNVHTESLINRDSPLIHVFLEKIPLIVLSAVSSIITLMAQKGGGAIKSFEILPLDSRVNNAIVSYVNYLWKTILPCHMAVFYPYPPAFSLWSVVGAGVFIMVMTIMLMWYGRRYPYGVVGWLWYMGTLVPVIGFVQAGSQAMADRYSYVPLIGIFIMVVWGTSELFKKWHYGRITLAVLSGCVLTVLIVFTSLQVQKWRDTEMLFRHTARVTDDNFVAHDILGYVLLDQGRLDEASIQLREALRINPEYANANTNMAVVLMRQGKYEESLSYFCRVSQLRPGHGDAYYNLGIALIHASQYPEAVVYLNKVLASDPDHAGAHNNIGIAFVHMGKRDEAIFHFREALRIKPDYENAKRNLERVSAAEYEERTMR